MQANDFPRFKSIITGMSVLYRCDLSKPLLDAYWLALTDWELPEFEAAAARLMKTEEFLPKPVAFNNLRKAGRPTGGEAWTRVLDYARHGYSANGLPWLKSNSPEPDDPLIRRAVAAIGGYGAIAMSDTSKTSFLERRFCEHFEQMQDVEETREAVPEIAFDRRAALSGPTSVGNLLGRISSGSGS